MNKQLKILGLLFAVFLLSTQFASAFVVDVLSTDPAPLKAGEFADVTLQVESGIAEDDFTNAQLYIKDTNFIRSVSATKNYDVLRTGRSVTETLRVFIAEDLPEGYVDIPIILENSQTSFEFTERVFVEAADSEAEIHIGAIKSVPQELLPDTDNNQLTITLQNLGEKDAELVKVNLVSDKDLVKPSYSFSMSDSVSSIDSGAESELTFTVDIDALAVGEIPSHLEVQYRTKDLSKGNYKTVTKSIPFDIQLIDAPLLSIVDVNQVDAFMGGSVENKVIVTIRNDGTDDAESVRVRVTPDISYPFIFEKTTQYVSSKIKPGETATVAFIAEVNDQAEDKNYQLTANLESLVGETRYVREDTLNLSALPGSSASVGTVGMIIILVVIIFSLVIGVRTYRARKAARRHNHRQKHAN